MNIIDRLGVDEKILFNSKANIKETSIQIIRFFVGFILLLLFWIFFIDITGLKTSGLSGYAIIIFIVLAILTLGLIYGIVYNIFLKHKNRDNEYWITDKKIILYNPKKRLIIRDIKDIEYLGIIRVKNNYGDMVFNFKSDKLIEQIRNSISFNGIENPNNVASIIKKINPSIDFYDDKPTFMGNKIS